MGCQNCFMLSHFSVKMWCWHGVISSKCDVDMSKRCFIMSFNGVISSQCDADMSKHCLIMSFNGVILSKCDIDMSLKQVELSRHNVILSYLVKMWCWHVKTTSKCDVDLLKHNHNKPDFYKSSSHFDMITLLDNIIRWCSNMSISHVNKIIQLVDIIIQILTYGVSTCQHHILTG